MKNTSNVVNLLFFVMILSGIVYPQQFNTSVQNVINEVSLANLISTVSRLSGEKPVTIGSEEITILSRYMNHPHNDIAADFIKQELEGYGLDVEDQYYVSSRNTLGGVGRNIIAKKLGVEYPEKKYILCAHYDSITSNGSNAPGADDNASGTAAVLEAARILSGYQTKYTMLFILFDEEELGMIGSNYYANSAWSSGEEIMGVINMDMIAFDSNSDWSCDVHTRNISNSEALKNKMLEVNSTYSLMLNVEVHSVGTTSSDQSSFWNKSYGAILLIEDYEGSILVLYNDFNAFYHTANDRLFAFNSLYYKAMSKLSVGTFAELAEIVTTSENNDEVVETAFLLSQNYPNPFNPSTKIVFTLPHSGYVRLTLFNILGDEIEVFIDGHMQAGSHHYNFNAKDVSSGVYFYQLLYESKAYQRKMIVAK